MLNHLELAQFLYLSARFSFGRLEFREIEISPKNQDLLQGEYMHILMYDELYLCIYVYIYIYVYKCLYTKCLYKKFREIEILPPHLAFIER
jgi:hypothetical protein